MSVLEGKCGCTPKLLGEYVKFSGKHLVVNMGKHLAYQQVLEYNPDTPNDLGLSVTADGSECTHCGTISIDYEAVFGLNKIMSKAIPSIRREISRYGSLRRVWDAVSVTDSITGTKYNIFTLCQFAVSSKETE